MNRAQIILLVTRVCFVILAISAAILMLGPFQRAEEQFGITDKMAHVIAFYGFTVMLMVVLPRLRRTDIIIMALTVGALIEVTQTLIGRSGSIEDWLANLVGVICAVLPTYATQLRADILQSRRAGDKGFTRNLKGKNPKASDS